MRRGLFAALVVVMLCLVAPAMAAAQPWTWTGGSLSSSNWSDGLNWDQLAAPSSGADLTFPASPAGCLLNSGCYTSNNDESPGFQVGNLIVDAGSPYSIGGNGITLTGGLTTTASGSSGSPAINLPIDVSGTQSWNVTGGTVGLGGPVTNDPVAPGDVTLALGSGGQLSLGGADSLDSLSTSGAGTLALGDSTAPATLALSSASALGAGTTLALPIDGPGAAFSQLSAPTIDVSAANPQVTGGANCSALVPGQVDTIVESANVTGPFANAPDGTTVPLCTGIEARINYGSTGVTATIIGTPGVGISISPTTPVTNQPVTATATVSGAGPTPSGTITMSDGSLQCTNVPLVNGAASCALGSFAAGQQTIQVVYTPDVSADYLTSSASQTEAIGPDPAAMALAGPMTVGKGLPATYSIQLVPTYAGPIVPSGTVSFEQDGQPVIGCTGLPLQPGSLTASCSSVAFTTLGSHTVAATYADANSNFTANASQPVLIDPAGSTTSISTLPGNPETNEPTTVIAQVAANGAAGQPQGEVEFKDGAADLCPSVVVDASGVATCDVRFAGSGTHDLTSIFTPKKGSTVAQSTGSYALGVQRAPTQLDLTASSPSPTVNQPVTYTATVSPTYNGLTQPLGTVSFADNGATISGCASRPVGANETATCTVGYPDTTTHAVTATYSGDANFSSSSAGPLIVTITPRVAGISATTLSPAGVTTTSAKLKGVVATGGAAVTWQFQYGTKLPYTKATPAQSIGAGHGSVPVSSAVKGLRPGTRYHVQLVVLTVGRAEASTAAFGRDLTFTTKPIGSLTLAFSHLRTATSTVAMPLRCAKASACRGRLTLTATAKASRHGHPARKLSCAQASYRIAAGRTQTVTATLSRACQTLARAHHGRLPVTASVTPSTPQLAFTRLITLVLG